MGIGEMSIRTGLPPLLPPPEPTIDRSNVRGGDGKRKEEGGNTERHLHALSS